MSVGVNVLLGLLTLGLMIAAILDYRKVKKFLLDNGVEPDRSLSFVDLLFHERLKGQPRAMKIQKRAIGLFCASLLVVHVAMLYCGSCFR